MTIIVVVIEWHSYHTLIYHNVLYYEVFKLQIFKYRKLLYINMQHKHVINIYDI